MKKLQEYQLFHLKLVNWKNDNGYLTAVPTQYITEDELAAQLTQKSDVSHTHTYNEITGAITRPNSTTGKISFTKKDGTVVDGLYMTSSNNLRVGSTNAKTNIFHTVETSDMVFP